MRLRPLARFAAAALLAATASAPAQAQLVSWNLTVHGNSGTYFGGFSFDQSLVAPNAFITFSDFVSFQVVIDGYDFQLVNSFRPNEEGLLLDAAGAPLRFDDPTPGGSYAEFCSSTCVTWPVLAFVDGTNQWQLQGAPFDDSGTYSFSPTTSVPEPVSLSLMAIGLVGLGLVRLRRHNTV